MKTNLLKRAFILVGIVIFGTQVFAQEAFTVKGRIVNSNKQVVYDANVNLLDPNTLEIISTGTCNENGEFVFENVKKGEYIFCVNKPGFKKTDSHYVVINADGKIVYNSEIVIKNSRTKASEKDEI